MVSKSYSIDFSFRILAENNLRLSNQTFTVSYIGASTLGYILILSSGTGLSRLLIHNLASDIFNKDNETFPQEERKLENEFSINLPAQYYLKGKTRKKLD